MEDHIKRLWGKLIFSSGLLEAEIMMMLVVEM